MAVSKPTTKKSRLKYNLLNSNLIRNFKKYLRVVTLSTTNFFISSPTTQKETLLF